MTYFGPFWHGENSLLCMSDREFDRLWSGEDPEEEGPMGKWICEDCGWWCFSEFAATAHHASTGHSVIWNGDEPEEEEDEKDESNPGADA